MEQITLDSLQQEIEMLRNQLQDFHEQNAEALKMYKEMKELEVYQAEMVKLQKHIENNGKKLVVVFEGRDAAGKGSLIGTISRYMNPKHYRIVALGKPTEEQKTQWYFQKYVEHFPSAGQIILFDRSWYNRAMVEPVFGFCTPQEYEIFMNDVTGFERSLSRQGIVLIKLYLSVKKSVQAVRFEQRKTDPLRKWKLSEVDLQAQGLWEEFSKMKYEMLDKTNHPDAPWYVIRSNDKHQARIEAMKLILSHFAYEEKNGNVSFECNPKIVIPSSKEMIMMRKAKPGSYTS
ncbi:MAG: polyphosphate kinase 2 [Campylobacterales bacterium]|nr:polyphosphate kinase 2 [Campylobacterales bacterium]